MTKRYLYGALALLLLLTSCVNEIDMSINQLDVESGGGNTLLQISVNEESITKASGQQTGNSFKDGAEIGVFVTGMDGSSYDNQDLNNVKYTAKGTDTQQTWDCDPLTPVMLSSTKGKVYAYYPRQESGQSLHSIMITNDGNDWMYTPSPATNVNIVNPTAPLTMQHAMTIIRVNVKGADGNAVGTVSRLTMDGTSWVTSAVLDLEDGTFGGYAEEGKQMVKENLGELSTTALSHDFWVVSNEQSSDITFRIKVDEDEFKVTTPTSVTLQRGKVYNFTMNVRNHTEAVLQDISIIDWSDAMNADLGDVSSTQWSKLPNGVYAIDNNGDPVDYATASTAPTGTYQGVAVVMKGKAFEIAKEVQTLTNWAETSPMAEAEQDYFSDYYINKATETITYGYLKIPNGSYHSDSSEDNRLPDDISAWSNGALANVDGKANTDRILAANVAIASVINSYNGSHSSTSWYLPAAGQLAYMFLNYDKINNLLPKVSGTALNVNSFYWSSTVLSAGYVWVVSFGSGHTSYGNVSYKALFRLVRDL